MASRSCFAQFPLEGNSQFGNFHPASKVTAAFLEDTRTKTVTLQIMHRLPEHGVGEQCSFEIALDKNNITMCEINIDRLHKSEFLPVWNSMKAGDPSLNYPPAEYIGTYSIMTIELQGLVDKCTKPLNPVTGTILKKTKQGAEFLDGMESAKLVVRLMVGDARVIRILRRFKNTVEKSFPHRLSRSAMRNPLTIGSATSVTTKSVTGKKRNFTETEGSIGGDQSELGHGVTAKFSKLDHDPPSMPGEFINLVAEGFQTICGELQSREPLFPATVITDENTGDFIALRNAIAGGIACLKEAEKGLQDRIKQAAKPAGEGENA